MSSSVEPILQFHDFVFADHNSQLRKSMKANGHFVFEEIGDFVNALDIYHILAADTEEQIGIQLLFQVTQRLIDGYRITITKICSNDTILREEITNVSSLDKFEAIIDMHKEMVSPFLACCHPHFLHQS